MLTGDDYDTAYALLTEHGVPIVGASGRNGPFGSWHITVPVAGGQGVRLVHDGRDGWLFVERGAIGQPPATNFRRTGELWVARRPTGSSVREAVDAVLGAIGPGGEDAPS